MALLTSYFLMAMEIAPWSKMQPAWHRGCSTPRNAHPKWSSFVPLRSATRGGDLAVRRDRASAPPRMRERKAIGVAAG
jgi:hypothetical protein